MRTISRQRVIERSDPRVHRGRGFGFGRGFSFGRGFGRGLGRGRGGDRTTASRLVGLTLGLALSALAAHPAVAEKPDASAAAPTNTWYAQSISHSDTGMNVTYLWSLKAKFRAEIVARGHRLVTIVNGDTYYAYDALTMSGIAIRRAASAIAADSPNRRPFGNEAQLLIEQGGERIREDSVAGRRAGIYQVTDQDGRRIVWATDDDRRLPIRVEVFDRKAGSTRYKEYVDWVSGIEMPDAFFEPEPGIQFERLELKEYIGKVLDQDPASSIPILFRELLHGPAPD